MSTLKNRGAFQSLQGGVDDRNKFSNIANHHKGSRAMPRILRPPGSGVNIGKKQSRFHCCKEIAVLLRRCKMDRIFWDT